ncbi:hypothetical protein F5Y03DRAFT_408561 [Xylaria venustula]|nr:hypothetical protein F5Y03DRAFT_408561 [Xylaria venustula]
MAETSQPCSTFHSFIKLPAELRNEIWSYASYAILGDLKPALYAYKQGCWRGRWLLPCEQDHHRVDPVNRTLEFYPHLLDKARAEVSLALVNREAHSFVVKWAQRSGYRPCIRQGQFFFLRPFLPDRDAVFLCESDWYSLDLDAWGEIHRRGRSLFVEPGLTRIALPKTLLQRGPLRLGDWTLSLGDWIETYRTVRALYIVMDVPSDQDLSKEVSTLTHQRFCELENIHNVASWNADRSSWNRKWTFDFSHPTWGNKDRQLVEKVCRHIKTLSFFSKIDEFEIFLCSHTIKRKL